MDHFLKPNQLANFRFILIFLITAFLIFGCASHDVAQTSTLETLPDNKAERVNVEGFELIAKPILTHEEHLSYFDNDLIKQGILPLQLFIGNPDKEEIYNLKPENIVLIDNNGKRIPAMSVEQIVQKTKKSYWRTAGWGVLFGIFGVVPSAINVSKTNEKIRTSYNNRMLKESTLRKSTEAEGLMFYEIPKELSSIDDWNISMVLKDASSRSTILKYQLRGDIPVRESEESP